MFAIDPDDVDALNNKANAIASLGETVRPIASYENPYLSRTDYLFSEANLLEKISTIASNNLEEAIKLYDKALSITPGDLDIVVNKGIALYKLDRQQEAIQIFDKAISMNPEHVGCLYNKGMVLEQLGRSVEATEYKDRAQEIDPTYTGELINKDPAVSELKSVI